jgi:arylsulfatase A-like enzyme
VRPNVLVVVLDAARRDALGPYGAPPGSTPAIAQLAGRGRALPEVYATGCWTVPSHASFFTGLLPRAAGLSRVGSPALAKPVLESHRDRLLPEVLRRAGYSTAAVSANLWVSEASGFSTGFEEFEEVDTGRHGQLDAHGPRARIRWLAEAGRGRVDDGAAEAARWLEEWLSKRDRSPFFCFVNLIECHSPYLPPRGYGAISVGDRLRAAAESRRYYTLDAIWRACVGGYDVPDSTIERMRRLYRASIAYMDEWLGRLLERLDDARALDDTLVVITSDHGENFGEGGLLTHALSLDNRLIHVPFVASGPGAQEAEINSLADLPRLLARAVGLEDHPWRDGPAAGVGVAQFDPPVEPGDPRAAEAVERWRLGDEALERLTTPLTCAVADGLKLLRRGEREELYDLREDPLELAPLPPQRSTPERARRVDELRAALAHPAVTSRRSDQPSSSAPQVSAEETRKLEERMKLLGYM